MEMNLIEPQWGLIRLKMTPLSDVGGDDVVPGSVVHATCDGSCIMRDYYVQYYYTLIGTST